MKEQKEGSAAQLVAGHVIPDAIDTSAEDGSTVVNVSDTTSDAVSRERIAAEAYSLWMARGCRDDSALEDWLEAEQRVRAAARAEGDVPVRAR